MGIGIWYHSTVSIDYLLGLSDSKLEGLLIGKENGKTITPQEAKESLREYKRQGYKALPSCDNDKKGVCQGHPGDTWNQEA